MRPAPLDRKLLRDLWRMRWQVAAIALLIACGVSVAVMSYSAHSAIAEAQQAFYRDTRFADVFASARRAPLSRLRDLEAIPGVTAVDARLVDAGLLKAPGLTRPATVRLISLPDDPARCLNCVRIVRGRAPDPRRPDEALALSSFMNAAKLQIGDRLDAVIGGRAIHFHIVGAVVAPEFVYVPAPESTMPDDAHQGVIWAPRPAVERAMGASGAFNTAALALAPGVEPESIIQSVDRLLAPYGGRPAYAREDQVSNAFLDAELKELTTSAAILPPIFLLVAAALVQMVMNRLVEVEREQIGLLKAFGYGDVAAAANYLKLAALIGAVGAIGGGFAGGAFGALMVDLYRQYFRFPVLEVRFHWPAFAASASLSVAAAMAGAAGAVRRSLRLSPAVAMQPPRPARYRLGLLDRLARGRSVDQSSRMIVRDLERFPVRSGLAVLGLAASLSLLVGTQFLFDSLDQVLDHSYFRAQRWSESVAFAELRDVSAISNLRRLPGVYAAEPVRVAPVRIRARGREEKARLVGLEPDSQLHRALDGAERPVAPRGRAGVVLGEALAQRLDVRPGDQVSVEVVEGRSAHTDLRVVGLAREYSGNAGYIERRTLNRLMGEGDLASGAELLLASDRRSDFYGAVQAAPLVNGASSRDDTVRGWRQAMTESFRVSILFYLGFAGAIAYGVAYNTGRISLAERSRDLATLRVLGFGAPACAYILAGELVLLALCAIPIGLAGGYGVAHGLIFAYSRQDVRLPAVIHPNSLGLALGVYLAASTLAILQVARRIWRFDLVAVLKTRE